MGDSGGLQGPGHKTGCFCGGWLTPGHSSMPSIPSRHQCHLSPPQRVQLMLAAQPRCAEPVPEAWGAPIWAAQPQEPSSSGAAGREPGRQAAMCFPRAGRAGSRYRQLRTSVWGHQPWPRCVPSPSPPRRAQRSGDMQRARHPQLQCPWASCCSTHGSDAQHLPRRCPAPSTAMPSLPARHSKQGAHSRGASPPQPRLRGQVLLTLVAGRLRASCRQMHCV